MALRESKRHRDKRPFMPFGDMMLPVIGFVAVGLLVAGIKLFFLSGPKPRAYEAVAVAEQKTNVALAPTKTLQNEKAEKEPSVSLPASLISTTPAEKKSLILAVPASSNTKREVDSAVKEEESKKEPVSRKKETKNSSNKKNISIKTSLDVKNKPFESISNQKDISSTTQNTTSNGNSSSRWGIQVGSFTEKNVADSVAAKLQKKGYRVIIISAIVHEKKYYRVIVVEGTDKNKAESRAQLLTREGYPVLVIPVK